MNDFEEKLNEILKDTEEYDKIKSELGDSYILSENDEELESILNEFSEKPHEKVTPIKESLSTDELIAVTEGETPSVYNVLEEDSKEEIEEKAEENPSFDNSGTIVFGKEDNLKLKTKTDYESKTESEIIDEKILKEKEDKFFGSNSKLKESFFNWEKDKDLKVPSKEEGFLLDGQVSFLAKEESEQEKKISGYFTDVYDVNDVLENSRKLKELKTKENQETATVKFSGIIGKLFNEPESEEEVISEEENTVSSVEDYELNDSANEIKNDLNFQKRQALIKIIFAAVISAVLLLIDLAVSLKTPLPKVIDYANSPFTFGIAELGLLLAVIACGARSFFDGFKSIFTLKPSNDTPPAIAMTVTVIGVIVFMLCGGVSNDYYSYSGIVSLCFTANLFSKYLRLKTIYKSFEIISGSEEKHVLVSASSFPGGGAYSDETVVMKTDFVKGFMDSVTSYDGTERNNIILVPALAGACIISILLALFNGYGAAEVFVFATNAAALTTAFISPLSAALPIFNENASLYHNKATVLSIKAADMLSEKETVVIKDTELFNEKNMKVTGMKVFDESEIYNNILLAASLYKEIGGPASAAFLKLLSQDAEMLEVSDKTIRAGIGISATVGDKRIYTGIPSYIESLGVDMRGIDLKSAYLKSAGRIIAIADDNKLLAVFSLSYVGGVRMKRFLRNAGEEGLNVTVCTDDPNISSRMICNRYKVDNVNIKICGTVHDSHLHEMVKDKSYIPSKIVSADGPLGIFYAMTSALRQKRTVKTADIIRIIAVLTGAFVSVFLAASGSLELFGVAAVIVFQIIWLAVLAVITFFRL